MHQDCYIYTDGALFVLRFIHASTHVEFTNVGANYLSQQTFTKKTAY